MNKKSKEYYLNKYIEVRQNAFLDAFNNDIFEGAKINIDKTIKEQIEDIFNQCDLDSNEIINSFGNLTIDNDYYVGYFLYFYKEEASDFYLMSNDKDDIYYKLIELNL